MQFSIDHENAFSLTSNKKVDENLGHDEFWCNFPWTMKTFSVDLQFSVTNSPLGLGGAYIETGSNAMP